MKITTTLYIVIGYALVMSSSGEAYAKRSSGCVEPPRASDGKHGLPGYLEDGEDGEDGEKGKNGQDGGHGGNGGGSIYGNGGHGGHGGDAD